MIRKASLKDIDRIGEIYAAARKFMRATGNPTQWLGGYPSREQSVDDIANDCLFVVERQNEVCGVFYFKIGEDPTYKKIDGEWKDNSAYGVIHRIASGGTQKGIFTEALEFCSEKISHIRIDTHSDNTVMQSVLLKHGFCHCGTIYLENGDPRMAYEKSV